MDRRRRKALSPLIATTLLIVIAILGGLLIYQYFGQMVSKVGKSEGIGLWAQVMYINSTTSIAHLRVINLGSRPITVTQLFIDGVSVANVNLGPIPPGEAIEDSIVISDPGVNLAPGTQHVIYINYTIDGKTYTSEPVKVIVQ